MPRGDLPVDPVILPYLQETAWKQFCAHAKTFESTHHPAYETVSRLSSTIVSNPWANDRHFLAHYIPPQIAVKKRADERTRTADLPSLRV